MSHQHQSVILHMSPETGTVPQSDRFTGHGLRDSFFGMVDPRLLSSLAGEVTLESGLGLACQEWDRLMT